MAPETPESDSALWQRFCAEVDPSAIGGASASLSLVALAAYLDGRLSDVDRDHLEAALAEAPDARALLESVLDDAAGADTAGAVVPRHVLTRARALAPERETMPTITVLRRSGAVAAAVVVALIGWRLGHGTVGAGPETNALSSERLAQEMSFGLFTTGDDLVLDSMLLASLEVES